MKDARNVRNQDMLILYAQKVHPSYRFSTLIIHKCELKWRLQSGKRVHERIENAYGDDRP